MCRSKADGGRKCPAHTDPATIAKYNKQRREKYARDKARKTSSIANNGNTGFNENTFASKAKKTKVNNILNGDTNETDVNTEPNSIDTNSNFAEKANEKPLFDNEVINTREGSRKSSSDLFNSTNEVVSYDEKLNVSQTKNEGYLSRNGYYNSETLHGSINYTQLKDNPYTAESFGFKKIANINNYSLVNRHADLEQKEVEELSRLEMKDMNQDEKDMINFYTGEGYESLNEAVWNDGKSLDKKKSDLNHESIFSAAVEFYRGNDRTHKNFERLRNTLDSALDKGPKKQRLLYQGVLSYGKDSPTGSKTELFDGKTAKEWANKKIYAGERNYF